MKKRVRHNPFMDLTNSKVQYWLGWIAADGSLYEDRLALSLKREDRDVLEKFRDFLSPEIVIYDGVHKKSFGNFLYSRLAFRNKEVLEYLNSLGFTNNKTFDLEVKFDITWDYIRGFFEGDGCLDWPISFNRPRIQIAISSEKHLKQLSDFLTKNGIQHRIYDKSKNRKSNHWSLEITRKVDSFAFLANIYKNACTYMDRKYNNAYKVSDGFTKMCQIQGTSVRNPEPNLDNNE